MNRNYESQFAMLPTVEQKRSTFHIPFNQKTTCNAGKLVPFFWTEVLPGDTMEVKTAAVIRMSTPIVPTADNCWADLYYFYVPNRVLWSNWRHFCGEPEDYWMPTGTYSVPQTSSPSAGWQCGSVADHLGIPIGVATSSLSDGSNTFNSLPFRAYVSVWNEWFRDNSLLQQASCPTGDSTTTGLNPAGAWNSYISTAVAGGDLCPLCKPHGDPFTSALPAPLRAASPVTVPMGTQAPVYPTSSEHKLGNFVEMFRTTTNSFLGVQGVTSIDTTGQLHANAASIGTNYGLMKPTNLWADLAHSTAASINELRFAFALQRYYERINRSGNRYRELINSLFSVDANLVAPDDRPIYLGGKRVNISINQVAQTSSTDSTTPQGNLAAYSHTAMSDKSFIYSATEHGILIGVMGIRAQKSYQQGVNRMWRRKDFIDYYNPVFANIGEQAIRNDELYYANTNQQNGAVFGYNEAWYEYRYFPNQITGEFRSTYATPLDFWHYGDDYSQLPTLSGEWIVDNSQTTIGRTLAVSTHDQFLCDIALDCKFTRCMGVHSIPGQFDRG